MNSPVTITEILLQETRPEEMRFFTPPELNVSDDDQFERGIVRYKRNRISEAMAERQRRAFQLNWEGALMPMGAIVGGKTIASTLSGVVTDTHGEQIGYYYRTREGAGQNRKHQEILVFLHE